MRSLRGKIILAVVIPVILSVILCGIVSIGNASQYVNQYTKENMCLVGQTRGDEINTALSQIEQSVDTLTSVSLSYLKDFEEFKTNPKYVEEYTETIAPIALEFANHTEGACTCYVRYNPEFTEPTSGIFYSKSSADAEFEKLVPTDFSIYEPDDLEHVGWYYIPVGNKAPTWMEPYYNSNIDVFMVSYVVPIYVDGESVGIIGMDIDFSQISDLVDKTSIYDSGYAYLVNESGNIMYHKDLELGKNMVDLDASLKSAVKKLTDDNYENTIISYQNQGKESGMSYTSLRNGMRLILTAPEDEIYEKSNTLLRMILIIAVAALVLSIVVGLLMSHGIVKPIKQIDQIISNTAQFNFTHQENTEKLLKARDETGEMARSTGTMRENLRNMLTDIEDASDNMSHNVEGLQDTAMQISEMSEDNSATTQELAAAMQETAATMETINQNVLSVKDKAENIRSFSQEGKKVSEEVRSRAMDMQQTTDEASARTMDMYQDVREKTDAAIKKAEAVQKINELTNAILSISQQTNLLALNASIEAARAGEAGLGFAVVATEIGGLASQTSEAVTNINQIIGEVKNAVDSMEDCLQGAAEFLEGTVLKDYGNFTNVAQQYTKDAAAYEDGMTSIHEAIETLMESIIDITEAVEGINTTVNETTEGVTSIADKTSDMTNISIKNSEIAESCQESIKKLEKLIEMFQTE